MNQHSVRTTAPAQVETHACMQTQTRAHTRTHAHTQTHTNAHTHKRTHAHTHTPIHARTHNAGGSVPVPHALLCAAGAECSPAGPHQRLQALDHDTVKLPVCGGGRQLGLPVGSGCLHPAEEPEQALCPNTTPLLLQACPNYASLHSLGTLGTLCAAPRVI